MLGDVLRIVMRGVDKEDKFGVGRFERKRSNVDHARQGMSAGEWSRNGLVPALSLQRDASIPNEFDVPGYIAVTWRRIVHVPIMILALVCDRFQILDQG